MFSSYPIKDESKMKIMIDLFVLYSDHASSTYALVDKQELARQTMLTGYISEQNNKLNQLLQ